MHLGYLNYYMKHLQNAASYKRLQINRNPKSETQSVVNNIFIPLQNIRRLSSCYLNINQKRAAQNMPIKLISMPHIINETIG